MKELSFNHRNDVLLFVTACSLSTVDQTMPAGLIRYAIFQCCCYDLRSTTPHPPPLPPSPSSCSSFACATYVTCATFTCFAICATSFPALSCLEPGTYGTKALRATTRLSGQALRLLVFASTYSNSGLILGKKNLWD